MMIQMELPVWLNKFITIVVELFQYYLNIEVVQS